MQLCSVFCGSLDGTGVWGRMNTGICMAESLCFSLETITMLLISYVLCLVAQLCLTLCDPRDCSPPGSSVHRDSPGKNTGMGCSDFPPRNLPNTGIEPRSLHCRQILYQLSDQGSPLHEYIHLIITD